MARQVFKVNVGYMFECMRGSGAMSGSAYAITSGGVPADARIVSVDLDRAVDPPNLVVVFESPSTGAASVTGFVVPQTAKGKADHTWRP